MIPSAGAIARAINEAVAEAIEAERWVERRRLARILADHGHVALAVCVETFDAAGAEVDRCRCYAPEDRHRAQGRDPDCAVCRGTGERQPTVQP